MKIFKIPIETILSLIKRDVIVRIRNVKNYIVNVTVKVKDVLIAIARVVKIKKMLQLKENRNQVIRFYKLKMNKKK